MRIPRLWSTSPESVNPLQLGVDFAQVLQPKPHAGSSRPK